MSPEMTPPPAVAREHHLRTHHGDTFDDPYEWLRDADDPRVTAYLEAENAYADAVTAHLEPLRRAIFDEIKSRTQETDLSVPVRSGPWWYFTRTVEGSSYPIHARCPVVDTEQRPELVPGVPVEGEQVLLDENAAAEGQQFWAVGSMTVSADHRVLAYAVDIRGDERFAVTVIDIETGRVLDTSLTEVGYGLELSPQGEWLYYTRVDDAWRPYVALRHRVGGSAAGDVEIAREDDDRYWVGVGSSRDERWLMVGIDSRTTSEVRLLSFDDPEGVPQAVAPRVDGVEYSVEPTRDRLLIVHNRDCEDFEVAWAPLDARRADQWRSLLRPELGQRILGVDAFDDFAVVTVRDDGLPALWVLDGDPAIESGYAAPRVIEGRPALGSMSLGDNAEPSARTLLVTVESWIQPRTVLEVDPVSGARQVLKRQPVLGGYDPADYVELREWVTAPDGTAIPVSIVHRRGVVRDGSNPCRLTAYGAYEIPLDPVFSVSRLSWLDRGAIYVTAHVRGGGELGRSWWQQGRLAAKPTTFTDVVAVAQHLIDQGWTASDRLALVGGSAGGLMAGAVANLAPDLFRVVHADVPFVDALTTILRPDLPLTVMEWDEWGNPLQDKAIYDVMKAYTPYENIADRPYPTIVATTSLNDTRVFFVEAAKWVAMLRATVPADPDRPILLRTEMVAGHGGRSGRYGAWEQIAWESAVVLDQLGVR